MLRTILLSLRLQNIMPVLLCCVPLDNDMSPCSRRRPPDQMLDRPAMMLSLGLSDCTQNLVYMVPGSVSEGYRRWIPYGI